VTFRFGPHTESHGRDGCHRIERQDELGWDVFIHWRHVATFFKRSDARVFIREIKGARR
jgi:hypothetical protein